MKRKKRNENNNNNDDGFNVQNELMKLSDAFEYFDRRNDGVITFEEV